MSYKITSEITNETQYYKIPENILSRYYEILAFDPELGYEAVSKQIKTKNQNLRFTLTILSVIIIALAMYFKIPILFGIVAAFFLLGINLPNPSIKFIQPPLNKHRTKQQLATYFSLLWGASGDVLYPVFLQTCHKLIYDKAKLGYSQSSKFLDKNIPEIEQANLRILAAKKILHSKSEELEKTIKAELYKVHQALVQLCNLSEEYKASDTAKALIRKLDSQKKELEKQQAVVRNEINNHKSTLEKQSKALADYKILFELIQINVEAHERDVFISELQQKLIDLKSQNNLLEETIKDMKIEVKSFGDAIVEVSSLIT